MSRFGRVIPEVEIDHERARRAVVTGEIAEERLEDVRFDADYVCIRYSGDDYSSNSHR